MQICVNNKEISMGTKVPLQDYFLGDGLFYKYDPTTKVIYFRKTYIAGYSQVNSADDYAAIRSEISSIVIEEPCSAIPRMFYGMPNASSITNLRTLDFNELTDMSEFFFGTNLSNINLSGLTFPNVVKAEACIGSTYGDFNNKGVGKADFSNTNWPKLTSLKNFADSNESVTEVNLSGINAPQLTNIYSLCSSARNLLTLNLRNVVMGPITNLDYIANGCYKIKVIDIADVPTIDVTTMNGFGNLCYELEHVYVNPAWTNAKLKYGNVMFNKAEKMHNYQPDISQYKGWLPFCVIDDGINQGVLELRPAD